MPEPPLILVDERVQDSLVELVVSPRVTVALKPPTGATVMVEVAVALARAVRLV